MLWGLSTSARLGLSSSEFATLMAIDLAGPTTPHRLAVTTGLSEAAVSRLVDRLVAREFVRRTPDPEDRRRILVASTDTWDADIQAAVEPHRRTQRAIFESLTPEEREAVVHWMQLSTPTTRSLVDPEAVE